MTSTDTDLLVLGGGLSGLTLALQVLRARPSTRVLVVEKSSWPPPVAAHKVGESTVELGTHYLREVLGLAEYLDAEQLPKIGLRFFFRTTPDAPLSERPEYGATGELPVPSHQLDRGLFEAELARRVQAAGGTFVPETRVTGVELDKQGHRVTLEGARSGTVTTRWVVDGTGRASTLKRTLGLLKTTDHGASAAWFRVERPIDPDTWDEDPEFRGRVPEGVRRLSTNHLMGPGYWVWLIPLVSGSTSIGIVADPDVHPLKTYSTPERALAWLREHEPRCAHALGELDGLQDFKLLRHYSHHTERLISPARWALTGDAGAFLDPFYSPGTDFIALANTYISDCVVRDLDGERIRSRANEYDRTFREMIDAWMPVYLRMYATFGVDRVLALKVTWDFSTYWAFQVPTFANHGFTDPMFMARSRRLWQRITDVNRNLQANLLHWARQEGEPSGMGPGFTDPMSLDYLREFHVSMTRPLGPAALEARLERNLEVLETVAAEITRLGAHRLYGFDLDAAVDPGSFSFEALARGEEQQSPGPLRAVDGGIRADLMRCRAVDLPGAPLTPPREYAQSPI